jgi:drug/metabolite transporter (DMT)-like permease
MQLSPQARGRALFAYLCVVWGTTWLGMKVGIAVVPPGVFAGLRWTAAGLILLAWRRARGEKTPIVHRISRRLLAVALLMVSGNQVIQLYGLKHVTAGLAAVISSALTPVSLLGFSVVLGQERFTWRQLGAIALGVCGVLALFGPAVFAGELDPWQVIGAGGVIVGCLCYSLGSVLARPLMRTLTADEMATLTNLLGGGLLLIASVLVEPGAGAALTLDWGMPAWLAFLYLLLPGSVIATVVYFILVRDWGPSRVGMYAFVSPVIAVVLGTAWFGERVDAAGAVGMLLMLGAAGLALRRG